MASVDSLRRQVAALRERIGRPDAPKQWVFHLYAGMELPACVACQISAHDMVFIKEIMLEYGAGEMTFNGGYVMTGQGNYCVDLASGKLTLVKQDGVHRTRRRSFA